MFLIIVRRAHDLLNLSEKCRSARGPLRRDGIGAGIAPTHQSVSGQTGTASGCRAGDAEALFMRGRGLQKRRKRALAALKLYKRP